MADQGQGSRRQQSVGEASLFEQASAKVTRSEVANPQVSPVADVSHAVPGHPGAAPKSSAVDAHAIASYRTAGTPPGFFRTPGDFHVHVDGARNLEQLAEVLNDLGARAADGHGRFPGKFNHIRRFAGGPQRDDRAFAETYRCHTPGSVRKEAFDSFSTIRLGSGTELESDAVIVLRRVLDSVSRSPKPWFIS